MSLEVFGDSGDGEDLVDLADRVQHCLCPDGRWREFDSNGLWTESETGLTDEKMWEYVNDRREGGPPASPSNPGKLKHRNDRRV